VSIGQRLKLRWQRIRKWNTVDHWIDLIVDVGLIAFDVLSSPILILVRFVRYFFNKFVNGHLKRFLKWIAHGIIEQRRQRLAAGKGLIWWYIRYLTPYYWLFARWRKK
jgi:hypothetical protein